MDSLNDWVPDWAVFGGTLPMQYKSIFLNRDEWGKALVEIVTTHGAAGLYFDVCRD